MALQYCSRLITECADGTS
uniref:Uncharacterized protein n=1 Tax=Anguilla anguilla TaxID=7936 RepID=A0A0E9UNI3_ANGAN